MDHELQERADEIFEDALQKRGARDPREFYRQRLRELKQSNPTGYDEAVGYYQETLLPQVASGDGDPLQAWLEYGRRLADLCVTGRTVVVDSTGRAGPYEAPASPEHLVLHLPRSKKERPLLVGLPGDLSPAQKATYDLLIAGKQRLSG